MIESDFDLTHEKLDFHCFIIVVVVVIVVGLVRILFYFVHCYADDIASHLYICLCGWRRAQRERERVCVQMCVCKCVCVCVCVCVS